MFISGIILASLVVFLGNRVVARTSTDAYCESCHIHPQSTQTWKRSTHFDNKRGIQVHCVDCHLPPKGDGYLPQKVKTGARDLWSQWFKDPEQMNWEAKSQIEQAKGHVFESSCIHCHANNFPLGLSQKGKEAHLYFEQHADELHCINCHITVGHYDPDRMHEQNTGFGKSGTDNKVVYEEPGRVTGFSNFTEFIPGSAISFEMVAIPGGTFTMGSPDDEPFRNRDEGPVWHVTIHPFFMGRAEVSWDEYLAFFSQTGAQGKTTDAYLHRTPANTDAISGPTPPYGAPDQGWGKGKLPAITMTHHAAEVYCLWLSKKTGKKYRLPTEAEWEYAARGGTGTPYFFDGEPGDYMKIGLRNRLFGVDTSVINSYANYAQNSGSRTVSPEAKLPNPFGLVNILGNVAEFCSDWYAEDAYSLHADGKLTDPGAETGTEHVIRGGSFRDEADNLRCAARDHTKTDAWLKTDPQIPKSIWWYSDCMHVGFRVVCEYSEPGPE
jgi:sulfatase modifying factor 1